MNAIELSKMIERYNSDVHSQVIVENYQLAADMLRRQHEAVKQLREALNTCVCAMQDYQAGIRITAQFDKGEKLGRVVLQKTEEFK